jgi:hypothetical protein
VYVLDDNSRHKNQPEVLDRISREFEVHYFETVKRFDEFAGTRSLDYFYSLKAGPLDRFYSTVIPNLVHAVFDSYEPHGKRFAYVSQTLADNVRVGPASQIKQRLYANYVTLRNIPKWQTLDPTVKVADLLSQRVNCENPRDFAVVPHIIESHSDFESNLRGALGIAKGAFVIGTLSGRDQFNLRFVREFLPKYLDKNAAAIFLAPNLEPFFTHERAFWLPKITNPETKTAYVNTLNVLLHGREMGESFGLAIGETLAAGKPVLSWSGGADKNHISWVGDLDGLYDDESTLSFKLDEISNGKLRPAEEYINKAKMFAPESVVKTFFRVFLPWERMEQSDPNP